MASQVRLVILASGFNPELNGTPAGLSNVYGSCAINYLMGAAKYVPRLQPVKDKVFIVTNEDHHASFVEWASDAGSAPCGAPAQCNIISNGCTASSSAEPSPLKDIALAVESGGLYECHLVVVSLDVLLDPYFSLQKFIEHSIVRGKNTVGFTRPPPGAELAGYTTLELEAAPGNTNPRVLGVSSTGSGQADGLNHVAFAPLFFLSKSIIPQINLAAENEAIKGLPSGKQLGGFLGSIVASGQPVYGLELDLFLPLTTPEAVRYADGFVAYCADSKIAAPNEASANINASISSLTKSGVDMGVLARGEKSIEELLEACSEVKLAYLYYHAAGGDMNKLGVVDSTAGSRPLPARFADMGTRRHEVKTQHPMYATTNNDYGAKKALQAHAPDSYHGANQFFSKTFLGGNTKISTMRTAVTYSKVHRALDDF